VHGEGAGGAAVAESLRARDGGPRRVWGGALHYLAVNSGGLERLAPMCI